MFKYIKKAYVMSIASSFENPGEAVDINETIETPVDSLIANTENISQLIKDIQEDGKIDGEDSENLQLLTNALEITGEAKKGLKETKKALVESFKKTLQNGFTVSKQSDYSTFSSMMKTINSNIKLPSYVDIKSNTSSIFNGDNFSLALNDEGKINIYTSGLGAINGIAGEIDDSGNINGLGLFDNPLNSDLIANNNSSDLNEALKKSSLNDIRSANAQKTQEKTLAQKKPEAETDKTKPVELKDIEFINGKDKDKYLPTSATRKGIWTPITKQQVQKILNDGSYTSVKDFQKKNNLDDDGRIGGKTFMVLHNKLEK